jgi:hypothetical protein
MLLLHLVGVPYYFTYNDDARSHTNQGCLKFFQTMHSEKLDIFRIKAYFDFHFRIRQFPFNPRYLTSVSVPKSRDIKIFPFKTNSV